MKRETKIIIVKAVIGLASGIAVSAVVLAAVKNVTPVPADTLNKIIYKTGVFIVGSMAATAGVAWGETTVDSFLKAKEDPKVLLPQ